MANNGEKGFAYERHVSGQLSLWWSGGMHDDLFWRTSGSGGRATRRGKKNKRTTGHEGDIKATNHVGAPLTNLVTFEAKRGYKECLPSNELCKPDGNKMSSFESFIKQTIEAAKRAKTMYWALIIRRDYREAVIWMPHDLLIDLREFGSDPPEMRIVYYFPPYGRLVGMRFDHFLKCIDPDTVRKASKALIGR